MNALLRSMSTHRRSALTLCAALVGALTFASLPTRSDAAPRTRPKGAEASFTPKRPGPRAVAPTVFTSVDPLASRLHRFDDKWHIRTTDGRLLRLLADGAPQPAIQNLPKDMRLLVANKAWYGTTPKGIWRLESSGMKNVVFGAAVHGVQVLDGHFWWSDSSQGGSIHKQPIDGKSSTMMASNLGPADTFVIRANDYLVGMRGDEPRGIKRWDPVKKEAKLLFESRFFTRRFLTVAGRTFAHMDKGAGFIKEIVEPEAGAPKPQYFTRMVITAGGSRAVQVHGKSLVWCGSSGVYRLDLDSGQSAALALNTNPRDMVVLGDEAWWIDGWRRQLVKLGL